jgi:hypothetical protein
LLLHWQLLRPIRADKAVREIGSIRWIWLKGFLWLRCTGPWQDLTAVTRYRQRPLADSRKGKLISHKDLKELGSGFFLRASRKVNVLTLAL